MIARCLRSVHGVVLVGGLCVGGAFALAALGHADEPIIRKDPTKGDPELKKQYPFQSIANRLEYEKDRASKDVKLSAETKARLDVAEREARWKYVANPRTNMLYEMHRKEVGDFAEREGFGRLRMIRRNNDLTLATGSIAFAPAPAKEPNVGPSVALPRDQPQPSADAPVLPSLSRLEQFHHNGIWNFANFTGMGLVIDKTKVAGFNAHQFTSMPELQLQLDKEKPKDKWNVRRLELVGLLKHEKPVVYASENLPRMEELKSAPTRALTAFEQESLKALREGEDMVLDSRLNQIRMVGSVRATKTCMKCHEVTRGELLGAFSYLLQRDPPAPVEEK